MNQLMKSKEVVAGEVESKQIRRRKLNLTEDELKEINKVFESYEDEINIKGEIRNEPTNEI